MIRYRFYPNSIFTRKVILLIFCQPFYKVLPAVERELMVIGFTAFAFKIYLNAGDSKKSTAYLDALEYAGSLFHFQKALHHYLPLSFIVDVLVPFFSICSCFLGLILIIVSIKISENWSKGYHSNNYVLINDFFQHYYSWYYW